MKISELTQTSAVRRDMMLPLSIGGQNMSITLGSILDSSERGVLPISGIVSLDSQAYVLPGSAALKGADVVWDSKGRRFLLRMGADNLDDPDDGAPGYAGDAVYYENWEQRDLYHGSNGGVRGDCVYIDTDGKLYGKGNVPGLIRIGLTHAEETALRLASAVEVADEEEMERRIAAGEFESGRLYFTAEEE